MKLGIILNTNDPETAWNALRLANEMHKRGNEVSIFLLGNGVELENIQDKQFDVHKELTKFLDNGGDLRACGTCLVFRERGAGVCVFSSMPELAEIIVESDKVISFG